MTAKGCCSGNGGSAKGFFVDNDYHSWNSEYYSIFGMSHPNDDSKIQWKAPFAFIWKKTQIQIEYNPSPTDIIIISRINGVDGNQIITIPAEQTGIFEGTGEDNISEDDLINYKVTEQGGAYSKHLTSMWEN